MSQIHERLCRNRPHARHARAVFVGAHASSRRASFAEDSGASIYSRKESPLTKAISHTSETGRRSKTHPEKDSLGDPATSGPSRPRERRNIRRPPQVEAKARQPSPASTHVAPTVPQKRASRGQRIAARPRESPRDPLWARARENVAAARKTPAGARGKSVSSLLARHDQNLRTQAQEGTGVRAFHDDLMDGKPFQPAQFRFQVSVSRRLDGRKTPEDVARACVSRSGGRRPSGISHNGRFANKRPSPESAQAAVSAPNPSAPAGAQTALGENAMVGAMLPKAASSMGRESNGKHLQDGCCNVRCPLFR